MVNGEGQLGVDVKKKKYFSKYVTRVGFGRGAGKRREKNMIFLAKKVNPWVLVRVFFVIFCPQDQEGNACLTFIYELIHAAISPIFRLPHFLLC